MKKTEAMTEKRRDRGGLHPGEGSPQDPSQELPRIDFSTFVLSLATSALFHMGMTDAPDPASGPSGEAQPRPWRARPSTRSRCSQEKTRGNLSETTRTSSSRASSTSCAWAT